MVSALPAARAFSNGWWRSNPTWYVCRRPRRRSTNSTPRCTTQAATTRILSTRKRKATAVSPSTVDVNRTEWLRRWARALRTWMPKDVISRRISASSVSCPFTSLPAPPVTSANRSSSAFSNASPNGCARCAGRSVNGSSAGISTSCTRRSISRTGKVTRKTPAVCRRSGPGSISCSDHLAMWMRFEWSISVPNNTHGGPTVARPGRRTWGGASTITS